MLLFRLDTPTDGWKPGWWGCVESIETLLGLWKAPGPAIFTNSA